MIRDEIERFLSEQILNEKYSQEMLKYIDRSVLPNLSRILSNVYKIDIENTTFEEIDKNSFVPKEQRGRLVICCFSPKEIWIVENDDSGRILNIVPAFRTRENLSRKTVYQLASKIFIVTPKGKVSNRDLKQQRLDAKNGSVDRDMDSPFSDKSGYDVLAARRDLKDRLFVFTKDAKIDNIKKEFKALSARISKVLGSLALGSSMSWKEFQEFQKEIDAIKSALRIISLYKDKEINQAAAEDLEKILGLK